MATKKRTPSPAQLRALARGRAKLKAARRRGETPKRKKARKANPLKAGYSVATVSGNIAKLRREGYSASRASAAALRSARASYRMKHSRGAFPSHLAMTRTPRRNPTPSLMRQSTLRSDLKAGTTQTRRKTNPPHYVLSNGKNYFDGASWVTSKGDAAQYLTQRKAAQIGRVLADMTNKPVQVVTV